MARERRWARLLGLDDDEPVDAETPPSDADDIPELRRQLEGLVARVRQSAGRLPIAAVPQILELADLLDKVLLYVERQRTLGASVDTRALVTVSSAIEDYLPTTIDAFLAIPFDGEPEHAPAAELLMSQLALLENGMGDVATAVFAGDAHRLAVQGRFLETKFGEHDLTL